ncbi:MAG: ferritin family protein [Halanaerobiaceae bacterium]|nr:ferritin family protein [Halanaerobiaceae bacterium]
MFENTLNAVEMLEMAMNIEKRGYNFYTAQAEKTDDQELKELFLKLAEDEKDHYRRFNEFLEEVKAETRSEAEYVYDLEVSAYLRAIVEFEIFPEEEKIAVESTDEALRIAITAEKDSIMFYEGILKYNQGEPADFIEALIAEERQHFLDLAEYRKKLMG